MQIVNKIKKLIFDKDYRFIVLSGLGFYDNMDDEKYLKLKFEACMHRKLDLDNPKSINEKLQWLKLYNRKDEYTTYVDKFAVREYIAKVLGEEYLIPLVGAWDSAEEIDFDALPNQFVLKCNHNSGLGMCICKDKSKLNINKVRNELKKGMKQDYFYLGREWPYKNVKRKIIAEKFMVDESGVDFKDYKFYCFDGKVKLVMINSDRNSSEETKGDFFDANFNHLNFTWGFENSKELPKKPKYFDEMKAIAEKLSAGIPHVRIDLYQTENRIYFGEITFFDGSGFDKIEPIEWDYELGSWFELPAKNNNHLLD